MRTVLVGVVLMLGGGGLIFTGQQQPHHGAGGTMTSALQITRGSSAVWRTGSGALPEANSVQLIPPVSYHRSSDALWA